MIEIVFKKTPIILLLLCLVMASCSFNGGYLPGKLTYLTDEHTKFTELGSLAYLPDIQKISQEARLLGWEQLIRTHAKTPTDNQIISGWNLFLADTWQNTNTTVPELACPKPLTAALGELSQWGVISNLPNSAYYLNPLAIIYPTKPAQKILRYSQKCFQQSIYTRENTQLTHNQALQAWLSFSSEGEFKHYPRNNTPTNFLHLSIPAFYSSWQGKKFLTSKTNSFSYLANGKIITDKVDALHLTQAIQSLLQANLLTLQVNLADSFQLRILMPKSLLGWKNISAPNLSKIFKLLSRQPINYGELVLPTFKVKNIINLANSSQLNQLYFDANGVFYSPTLAKKKNLLNQEKYSTPPINQVTPIVSINQPFYWEITEKNTGIPLLQGIIWSPNHS